MWILIILYYLHPTFTCTWMNTLFCSVPSILTRFPLIFTGRSHSTYNQCWQHINEQGLGYFLFLKLTSVVLVQKMTLADSWMMFSWIRVWFTANWRHICNITQTCLRKYVPLNVKGELWNFFACRPSISHFSDTYLELTLNFLWVCIGEISFLKYAQFFSLAINCSKKSCKIFFIYWCDFTVS
jgi:hypothetical protein